MAVIQREAKPPRNPGFSLYAIILCYTGLRTVIIANMV